MTQKYPQKVTLKPIKNGPVHRYMKSCATGLLCCSAVFALQLLLLGLPRFTGIQLQVATSNKTESWNESQATKALSKQSPSKPLPKQPLSEKQSTRGTAVSTGKVEVAKLRQEKLDPVERMEDSSVLRAAVIIVGAARSLLWEMVCSNIKTKLLDGLARPVGKERWKLDVFLFVSFEALIQGFCFWHRDHTIQAE